MKKILTALFIFGFIAFAISCKKKKEVPAPTLPLTFTNLAVNPNVIAPGDVSTITATASGSNLTYKWTMSHGDLLGSGSVVEFAAQPCCIGTITVTCVASDGQNNLSQTTTFSVRAGH